MAEGPRGALRLLTARRAGAACAVALVLACPVARADRQMDPQLGGVLELAIQGTGCAQTDSRFDTEVYFKLQEPRLRAYVKDPHERVEILRQIWCETHRVIDRYRTTDHYKLDLPPELVLAVIDVESRFDRYAVSPAGAVGLMQVMPFWPQRLHVENRLFGSIGFNVRLGVEILAYYMSVERNNYRRALARYNGSIGRDGYPDLVLNRLYSRWRA